MNELIEELRLSARSTVDQQVQLQLRRAAAEIERLGIESQQRKENAEYWKRRYDECILATRKGGTS